MKKFFAVLTICFCCFAARGQQTRPGQELPHAKPGVVYPVKVHVTGVHYRTTHAGTAGMENDLAYMDAIMDGEKVELLVTQNVPFRHYNFPLGDYQARLLKDSQKNEDLPLFGVYELLLPNNIVWRCTVTGILE